MKKIEWKGKGLWLVMVTVVLFLGIRVSAVDIPPTPEFELPDEPNWTEVQALGVTTTEELQVLINSVGETPTKIILQNSLTRTTEGSGSHALFIKDGQTICFASEQPAHHVINSFYAGDTTRGVVGLQGESTLYLENIRLTGGVRTAADGGGGGVLLGQGTGNTWKSVLVMKQGSVIEGNAAGFGGGIYVSANCEVYIDGGKITENSVTKKGGAIYAHQGGRIFLNGEVSKNHAGEAQISLDGLVDAHPYLLFAGGEITSFGAHDKTSSGWNINGIQAKYATVDMTDGVISGHRNTIGGGAVRVIDSIFNFYGGQLTQNNSRYGGAVNIYSKTSDFRSTMNMYGGVIGGDTWEETNIGVHPTIYFGKYGNYPVNFHMYGGKISHSDGYAADKSNANPTELGGAAIGCMVRNCSVKILGNSEISYCRSQEYGGAMWVDGSTTYPLEIGEDANIHHNSCEKKRRSDQQCRCHIDSWQCSNS